MQAINSIIKSIKNPRKNSKEKVERKKKNHETNPTEIYESVKNPNEINNKLMEIHTHIINRDYNCLEENI